MDFINILYSEIRSLPEEMIRIWIDIFFEIISYNDMNKDLETRVNGEEADPYVGQDNLNSFNSTSRANR